MEYHMKVDCHFGQRGVFIRHNWATKKKTQLNDEVHATETYMLRSVYGETRKDITRNEHMRGNSQVAPIGRTIMLCRLKWLGTWKSGNSP